jgi:endonuclease YncB( thermonuclease family)
MGIDTPETRTRDPVEKANGLKSKEFVIGFVADGSVIIRVHGFGKFGRPLVDLYKGDICLNERLVHFGLAAPYFGGKR